MNYSEILVTILGVIFISLALASIYYIYKFFVLNKISDSSRVRAHFIGTLLIVASVLSIVGNFSPIEYLNSQSAAALFSSFIALIIGVVLNLKSRGKI
jgi:hypothetical protein